MSPVTPHSQWGMGRGEEWVSLSPLLVSVPWDPSLRLQHHYCLVCSEFASV